MKERLDRLICDMFQIPPSDLESASMQSVRGWDSLKHVELVLAIQEEFKLNKVQPEEIVKMTSYLRILEVLRGRGVAV